MGRREISAEVAAGTYAINQTESKLAIYAFFLEIKRAGHSACQEKRIEIAVAFSILFFFSVI